ncbi:MAG TPA: fibronectin type III domain-containing protein, partial [Syntrophorhabdaceae bacterium]
MTRKKYILLFSVLVLLLCGGCGKKGFPTPERLPVPGGIHDLAGEVKDGVLFLSFTMPLKDRTGVELKERWGFQVLKSCGSCMEGFEPWRDIILEENQGYTVANGKLIIFDDDLRKGYQYSYRVRPVTRMGSYGEGSNVFTITWQIPPDPPSKVTVKGGDGRVELSWTREDNLLYNVYRLQEKVYPLFPVNAAPLSTPAFDDAGLENGKTYRYEVRSLAMKAGFKWEGRGTEVAAATIDRTPPTAPLDVKTEKRGKGVLVTWTSSPEKDVLGYNIFRISGGARAKLNREPLGQNRFLD